MNLFYLSHDPEDCARQHVDKHVVKMIVESAQLLCTAHRVLDGKEILRIHPVSGRKGKTWIHPRRLHDELLYKSSHVMHPAGIWIRQTADQYMYLFDLFKALNAEYMHRYNNPYGHSTFLNLEWVLNNPPVAIKSVLGFVDPPQCMPVELKAATAIEGYRNFYIRDKIRFATYTNRRAPDWYRPYLEEYHRETGFKYER